MPQLKELLIEELQDLVDAETQLTAALPKMADAAHHPKLKEAFQKHLVQTEGHRERLQRVLARLGGKEKGQPCKAMAGLVEEAETIISESTGREPIAADLALIAGAQKVEHYEIASYGTARGLARQLGEYECARLLSHTLGEEESADFLLTALSDPLMQQATLDDTGADVDLAHVSSLTEGRQTTSKKKANRQAPASRRALAAPTEK